MTERYAMYRTVLAHPEDDTPRLAFADFLEDNGEPELSEFVRVQVELEQTTKCSLTDYDLLFKRREGCRCCLLRSRERELFSAHGAEWFGANATMAPPIQAAMEYAGPNWYRVVPARGFPAHWYGAWEQWVGWSCAACDGSGYVQYSDPNSVPVGGNRCRACIDGRIPGACETIAWRPTWEMECPNCEGEGTNESPTWENTRVPCPDCGGQWESKDEWGDLGYSAGSGRVPRPCPPGAWPIGTVTLTTMPPWFTRLADGRWHEPTERAEFDSDNECKHVCELRWPGLTFHLPNRGPR